MLIVFSGYRGSGKDTIGKWLVENHNFKRLAFADAVKTYASKLCELDPELFFDISKKDTLIPEFNATPRDITIHIGQMAKGISVDIWAKKIAKKIQNDPKQDYVITDCRFPIELETMKELGAVSIWIKRSENIKNEITENSLSEKDCDFMLDNRHTLEDAYEVMLDLIEKKKKNSQNFLIGEL